MTHILLVAPVQEVVLHNIEIWDNTDVHKVQAFIKDKTKDYGDIERIIISMGTVRIMDKDDPIPIPLQYGGGPIPAYAKERKDVR
jgi:hypothetical protein